MSIALNSWWKPRRRVRAPRERRFARPCLEWLERRLAPAGFDTLGTAIVPVFDAALHAHDTRTLSTVNTVDLYAVTLKAGEAIVADALTPQAGSLKPALRIFDGTGKALTPLDSQAGPNPELSYAATIGGIYYVGVSSAGDLHYDPTTADSGSGGTSTGTFTLDLTRSTAAAEQEPIDATGENDTPQTAEALTAGTNLRGNLPPGDADFYRFTVGDSGRFRVSLTATDAQVLAPRVSLLDASGNVLVQSDGRAAGDPTATLDQHLQAGTYLLEVSARANTADTADDHGYELMTQVDTASSPLTPLPVGGAPESVAVEDINGDGIPDLVTPNKDANSVSVLLGSGDGTFESVRSFDVGTNPMFVAEADVNGDGIPDLITANFGSNDVSVLLGKGDGSFGKAQSFAAGVGTVSVAVRDVNGDGRPDLVTANETANTASVLLGNGDGTFGPAQSFAVGNTPPSVKLVDANGDGRPDIVTANFGSGSVSVLLQNLDGTFGKAQSILVGKSPEDVQVADLNGDGIADLVTANRDSNSVSVLLGNGDGTFRPAQSLAVGSHPVTVAVADVNGDGRPDLVTANFNTNDASVLLGNGDGTFQAAQSFDVGNTPIFLAVQDVNGDGRPDLVIANRDDNNVRVFLGNGDGTFQQKQSLGAGSNPVSVKVADVNGDGRPDLVTANRYSNDVNVLLGNGDGTFGKAQSFAVGNSPTSVAVRDINGDGRPDLVVANANSNSVSVLLGNGDGSFRSPQSFAVGSRPFSVAVADVNGDRIPDAITANFGANAVSVLLGKGDGTFGNAQSFDVGKSPFSVAVLDLDGDGRPDIVTANRDSNDVSVLLGEGDGTFGKAQSFTVGTSPESVALQDLDGDGRPDIVTTNSGSDSASVLMGKGDGSFGKARSFDVGSKPFPVTVADVNGDGRPDIVSGNTGDGDVSVLLGKGDGTFERMQFFVVGSRPFSVTVADVNGDGRPDIVSANFGSNDVSVLLGQSDGGFQETRLFDTGSHTGPQSLTVHDVNGDGIPDLVTANGNSNNVSVLLGNGDGTFRDAQPFAVGTTPYSVEIADVNGDGIPDIITANQDSNDVSVLLGKGDGTFHDAQRFAAGNKPQFAAIHDVNGDGIPDLIVANADDNDVSVLFGNGDGTFQTQTTFPVGKSPESIAVADVNGDGLPDIVSANYDSNDVSVLLGNGDGTFQATSFVPVGTQPQSVTIQDVNGDGRPDVVTANAGSNSVSVLLGNGDGTFRGARTNLVGAAAYSVAVADFNGDGRPDIVTANRDSNSVSILLGKGDGTFQAAQPFAVGSSPFSVAVADLNGDGRPDIVTANYNSNDVSVLLIPRTNAFEPARGASSIPTRDLPRMADFNGDGIPDALSISDSGDILFRQGANDPANPFLPFVVVNPGRLAGDFTIIKTSGLPEIAALDRNDNAVTLYSWSPVLHEFQIVGSVATGQNPVRIASADLNGDGLDDLVIGNALDHSVTIAFQTADGRFDPDTLTQFVGDGPSSITFADLSGFGNDIVVSGQVSGDVTILSNDAGHAFDSQSRYRAGLGLSEAVSASTGSTVLSDQQTVGAVAADFSDSGYPDIVSLNRLTNNFTLLRNRGDGSFVDPQAGDVYALGSTPVQAIAGDFLHNGRQDLAVLTTGTDGSSLVLVYLANADGTFAAPIRNVAGTGATGFGFIPRADGHPDRFLVGNAYGDFLTLNGDGRGHFVVDRGDLDGKPLAVGQTIDGRQYAVVADQGQDRVAVYFRRPGTDQFDAPVAIDSTGGGKALLAPGAVQLIDLNDDGIKDLVVASRLGNDILVYAGRGDGTFGPPTSFAVGFEPVSFTAAFLEGGGVLDLAVVNQGSNDVSILKGSIDPVTHLWKGTPGVRLSSGGSEPISVEAGDFTGDGIPDLRVANRGGQISTLPGIGSQGQGTAFFRDNLASIAALGAPITDEVFDPTTGRDFVVSGGVIRSFDGTNFTAIFTANAVDTLGVVDGLLVAGFADGSVGLLTEEGSLLDQTAAFSDQPSALQALQDGDHIDVYLTLQGSPVPVFVSLLIPVLTELPPVPPVAQPTGLPNAELVLVATLLTGGLEEGTGQDAQVSAGEASFVLFLPPARVSIPGTVPGQPPEEDVPAALVVRADLDGVPPTEEFRARVQEALTERLATRQVFDSVEDLVETIKQALDQFKGESKQDDEFPSAFRPDLEFAALDRVAEALVEARDQAVDAGADAPSPPAPSEGESLLSLHTAFLVSWLCRAPAEQGGHQRRRLASGWVSHD